MGQTLQQSSNVDQSNNTFDEQEDYNTLLNEHQQIQNELQTQLDILEKQKSPVMEIEPETIVEEMDDEQMDEVVVHKMPEQAEKAKHRTMKKKQKGTSETYKSHIHQFEATKNNRITHPDKQNFAFSVNDMEYFRAVKSAMKENQFDGWIGREPNIMTAAGNFNQGKDQYMVDNGNNTTVDNQYLLAQSGVPIQKAKAVKTVERSISHDKTDLK